MKKRIVALLLCCVMLLTLSPNLIPTAVADDDAAPARMGVTVSPAKANLPQNKKVTLTANAKDAASYQWQIKAEGDLWVDISGETESAIRVSYAMVASLLNGKQAQLRCKTDLGVSDTATVTVTAPKAVTAPAPAKAAPKAGTVVKEAEAIGDAVTQNTVDTAAVNDALLAANDAAGATNEAAASDTYNIVINYVFADGKQAASPWTATIAAGSSFQRTVNSPVVLGYAPDQASVVVNVTNAEKDTTYTVTYSAAEVNYTVKHYQQNVDNDNYTLLDTETKTGYTENAVGEGLAKTYEGFYSLLYDTTTKIAADGSTEVEINYDRRYYLMSFDLDGGYGVEPIYARYGAKIEVGTPTKPGYSFTRWDKELPETMPAENSSYTAQWKVGDGAKVTIVVWGENADDEEYSFYHNSEIMAKPGEKLTLDKLQGKLTCGKEEHTHSADCGITCGHAGTHARTLACYGITSDSVDPNNFGDKDARTHFEDNCNDKDWRGDYTCKGLKQYLKDGSVCQYKNGYSSGIFGTDYEYYYFLYFGGKYYQISSSQYNSWKTNTGKSVEHGRDTYYVYEGKTNICTHTHDDSCYACGKPTHTHTNACYYNTSFMENPDLWKLVKSDEVTVAADGTTILNVYYDRVEFTLTFRENRNTVATIKKKWGAEISGEFTKAPFNTTYNGRAWECTDSSKFSYALQTLDRMPGFDATFDLYNQSSRTKKTIYYYVQKVGTTVNANQWPSNANNFDLLKQVDTYFNYATYDEEYHEIQGFTRYSANVAGFDNNSKDFNNNRLDLYYMRNSYTLKFYNHDGYVANADKTVQYEASLKNYYFEPAYPENLEPNAYVFAGWYTTAGCYEGSEADLSKMTMPASDVILYAKWTPKTHTVKTYLTKEVMDDNGAALNTWDAVTHGKTVDKPADPKRDPYTFVGWFYLDNGVEKAFDFSMPVNRDLDLYAKWRSDVLVSYTIRYQLEDNTEIAPPTTGSALAGTTKTFDAKTGTQLNEDYQSGYFPKTASHSLTIDIEGGNEYTFVYVPKAEVNYTVRYLEKDTNVVLHEEKHAATRDAVITEKFEQITGYAPDAYQKRLVLSAEEDKNVITFWYVKDEVHAPVQIIHWTQNIAGDGYTEYQSSTNLNGVIGQAYSETSLTIPGFTYNNGKSNASGTLTAEGLVLNLYYDRIEYPYEFRFLEQGTDKVLADAVTGSARYQAQVTQDAKTIPGYKLVKGVQESQAIQIAIEDPENVASKNVKTFYYVEDTVDIKYQVVGPANSGTLNNYQDNGIGVLTGKIANTKESLKGSTPTAADGFKFVGWFKDKACTQSVDTTWVGADDNKLTPEKTKNYGTEAKPAMGYEAATYYAKFEYDVADLKITKSGCENIDENQSFLFDVTGPDGYSTRVAIKGNGSVTITGLKIGEYTVKEVTSWSWRYKPTPGSKEITLQPDKTNAVNFVNSRENGKWLGGDAYRNNVFDRTN